jgi:hypothetical protein
MPLHREIIVRLVAPHPVLLVLPVAAYEIAVAVALMAKGWADKLGIVGAMLFLIGLSCRWVGRRWPTSS